MKLLGMVFFLSFIAQFVNFNRLSNHLSRCCIKFFFVYQFSVYNPGIFKTFSDALYLFL